MQGCNLKYGIPPLWPIYMGERRTTFAKAYGIKVRCYGEHVELENTLGTWEHIGNLMRTHWELEWKNIWNTLGTREK